MGATIEGHVTTHEAAATYNVNPWVITDLMNRLGIGRKFGKTRAIAEADIYQLEVGLKVRGHLQGHPSAAQIEPAVEAAGAGR
jgi:hypothetical protein